MGCSYDKFHADFAKKEHAKIFSEIFNEKLKDQLYWGERSFLNEDSFSLDNYGNNYSLWIDDEPLFKTMEDGYQFVEVIFAYLEAVPDLPFWAEYECTFNNCGAIVSTTYDYSDGKLTVINKYSDDSQLDYCPECDWDSYEDEKFNGEPLCTIDEWEEGETYRCPQCGAVLEWDVDIYEETWKMKDGHLCRIGENKK